MIFKTFIASSLLLICGTGLASAATIIYTESTTASGSLNGTPFTNSLITLTFTGDSTNVTDPGVFLNTVGTLTVNIAGLGTATFTDDVQAVDNQGYSLAGFGDITEDTFILGTNNAVFSSYDLRSAIGPITDASLINSGSSFGTSAGDFEIDAAVNSTFTASLPSSAAPEPASMVLVGLGLAGIAELGRSRSR